MAHSQMQKTTISVAKTTQKMDLPGFRFHPTEEELLEFYLKHLVFGQRERFDVIGFLNIYLHDPRDLPGLAKVGEREWYFFVPRNRKHGNGGGPKRTTENGYWKATGSDRRILSLTNPNSLIGLRKTLVFYHGRAPRGTKTDWVMNEYRLPDHNCPLPKDIVLCKIYKKATSLKVLEMRAAKEDEMKSLFMASSSPPSHPPSMDALRFQSPNEDSDPIVPPMGPSNSSIYEEESRMNRCSSSAIQIPVELDKLTDLQVPKLNPDWTQDSIWTNFNGPWLQSLPSFADILNFEKYTPLWCLCSASKL